MSRERSYTDDDLSVAIAQARSWRGVLRTLGLKATSASAMRSVRSHADRLGLEYAHFTGQRRWTDTGLADAVASAASWTEVATRLGLTGGSSQATLKGHAVRLGISTDHLNAATRARVLDGSTPALRASVGHLPRAGSLLAASWFTLCGHEVSWPLEPAVYDLAVRMDAGFQRIQVKTTSVRTGDAWVVLLTRSGRRHDPYDPDDIDFFFVIDGDLNYYLIPVNLVAGLHAIHLAAYSDLRLDRNLALG